MASKVVAKAAGGVMGVSQKQTLQSTGIWERVRRVFAVDSNRSNGVPLNPYFRNPTPGGNDPLAYDDPVTVPAGDIADNPYWKRDSRRNYPKLSFVSQADAVALLGVGSAAAPKAELVGEAGEKALVAAKEEGVEGGLARYFEQKGPAAAKDLLVNGLPPLPSGQGPKKDGSGAWEATPYELTEEQTYPEQYPCRVFK
ncbi:hypothetical protein JX265_002771 [Neoarthrinium moseri]|uniref:Uncharacterized protein n=1 Tax=Neoarthrinium moseri TaxID=1658444 RepID=A0A9P9WST3_9PEZI|nr:uncharacterized protein JN550_010134 [Neoarthrinium moseri]KAI1845144.1 hypothetical protein JX266_008691 [Neoarthrinium moseri]KAI1862609.1 hypothetical protein JN550_010134 [Neoarthrinium moseri]KAI1878594.1 hypothetical protein JX265_002771 [Neoarthrinium moseri]